MSSGTFDNSGRESSSGAIIVEELQGISCVRVCAPSLHTVTFTDFGCTITPPSLPHNLGPDIAPPPCPSLASAPSPQPQPLSLDVFFSVQVKPETRVQQQEQQQEQQEQQQHQQQQQQQQHECSAYYTVKSLPGPLPPHIADALASKLPPSYYNRASSGAHALAEKQLHCVMCKFCLAPLTSSSAITSTRPLPSPYWTILASLWMCAPDACTTPFATCSDWVPPHGCALTNAACVVIPQSCMLPSSTRISGDFASDANGGASLAAGHLSPLRAPVALAIGSSECDWAVVECTRCLAPLGSVRLTPVQSPVYSYTGSGLGACSHEGHDDECTAAAWESEGGKGRQEEDTNMQQGGSGGDGVPLPLSNGVGDVRLFKHRIAAGASAADAAAGKGDVFVNHNVCTFVAGMMHHASQMMMVNRFMIVSVDTLQPRCLLTFLGTCCNAAIITSAPRFTSALVANRACPSGFVSKGGAGIRRVAHAAPPAPHVMTWTRQMMKVAFYSHAGDVAAMGTSWASHGNMMRIFVLEEEAADLIRYLQWAHAALPPLQRSMGVMPVSLLPLEEE